MEAASISASAIAQDNGAFEIWLAPGPAMILVNSAGYAVVRKQLTAPAEGRGVGDPITKVNGVTITDNDRYLFVSLIKAGVGEAVRLRLASGSEPAVVARCSET